MNRLLVALTFSALQPCASSLAGESYVYLVAPLQSPREQVTNGWTGTYLTVDDLKASRTLIDAVNALDVGERSTRDDAAIVISALKTANEKRDLQNYLEKQMGFGKNQVDQWVKDNISLRADQKVFKLYDDKTAEIARKAIGLTAIGLGAGSGLLSIPLAFTGVGLIPAIAMMDISTSIASAGVKIFNNDVTSNYAEKAMPDLMVAMLGPVQAQPGQRINWSRAPLRPVEELVKRVRRATLLQKAIAAIGTVELRKADRGDEALLRTAQDLYLNDIAVGAMLLSVLSRATDEGRHLILDADIVASLEAEQLPHLALMATELAGAREKLEGIPNAADANLREARRKEIVHFARWTQAAILLNTENSAEFGRRQLLWRTNGALGDDADYARFDAARAEQTIQNLKMKVPETREKNMKSRVKDLIQSLRGDK